MRRRDPGPLLDLLYGDHAMAVAMVLALALALLGGGCVLYLALVGWI